MRNLRTFILSLLPLGLYASVDVQELHTNIRDAHTMQYEYKISKKLLFSDVDNMHGTVCSAYTPLECKTYNRNKGGFNLNTEHTWPQSKGAKHFPAQGDLHHLYATSK